MSVQRVAVLFDNTARPETTGLYCRRALGSFVEVEHFLPEEYDAIPRGAFDLYLAVDDGLRHPIPEDLRPSAYWAIDTHMDLSWAQQQAARADFVFAAQRDGAAALRNAVAPQAMWLPLACDPVFHRPHDVAREFDIAFVGRLVAGLRYELVELLRHTFPRMFCGERYFEEMARTYSASQLVFNRSVRNDINMRVFEALGCGACLLTNDVADNGQRDLFQDGVHLVTYSGPEELLDKARFYLAHDEARERVAATGRAAVPERHTYHHRMQKILQTVERGMSRTAVAVPDAIETPQVSACLVSWQRPDNVRRIVAELLKQPLIDDVVIWNNAPEHRLEFDDPRVTVLDSERNRVTYGRFLAAQQARHDVLYTQDDDCLVHNLDELWDAFQQDSTRISHNLKLGHLVQNDANRIGDAAQALLGWGAFFHRDWLPAFDRYRAVYGEDTLLDRKADRLFSLLLNRPHRPRIARITDLPGAEGAEALSVRADHEPLTQEAFRRAWPLLGTASPASADPLGTSTADTAGEVDVSTRSACQTSTFPARFKDRQYFEFPRPDLLALIPETAKAVLDVGCGAGALGAALKARQACRVWGIERDPEAASRARERLDRVLEGRLETLEAEIPAGAFDCVVCGDVLEHLADPQAVLEQIRRWLAEDGRLVLSIPNLRHHSVLGTILRGNFPYEPAGLLDEDHVTFFTRTEIEKRLERAGLALETARIIPTRDYQNWLEQGRPTKLQLSGLAIDGWTETEIEDLFVYQYLSVARPLPRPHRERTSIVIVTCNELSLTRQCLASLRDATTAPYELIVVDNGSTDGTVEFLRQQPDVQLIANPENRGFPAAVNQGIRSATGRQILLLNNDTRLSTGWLDRMLAALDSDPAVGLVGPYTNRTHGRQRISAEYDPVEFDHFGWNWGRAHRGERVDVPELTGFCLLIRRDVIERVGLFDERFGIGLYEDIDYCRRAREAGFRLVIAGDVFVHHAGHATFRGLGLDQDVLAVESERRFQEKWTETADSEVRSPADGDLPQFVVAQELTLAEQSLMAQLPTSAERVLLMGRPSAALVAAVRRRTQARLAGWLDGPRQQAVLEPLFDEVRVADSLVPEECPFPEPFDAIVACNLVEQRHPQPVLERLRTWLKPNGTLYAVAPTVRNQRVLAGLLRGHWTGRSPLDSDVRPLRWFTRRELEILFERSGWQAQLHAIEEDGMGAASPDLDPVIAPLANALNPPLVPEDHDELSAAGFVVAATVSPRAERGLTSIVLVTYNQLADTRQCVESLRFRTDEPYELICVDNGSTDGTPQYLQSLAGGTVIANADNRGFPAAVNQGLEVARGDQILLLNNDTVVTTGWLRRMLEAFDRDPQIGLIGPCSNRVSGPQQVEVTYGSLMDLDGFAHEWSRRHAGELVDVERLVGFCLLMRREVVERVGRFDERFGIGCFEDDDYTRRALQAGYRAVIARDAFVHHHGSRTFRGAGIDLASVLETNAKLYAEKWAERPAADGQVAEDLLPPKGAEAERSTVEVTDDDNLPAPRIGLSLCMIVRDNEDTIGACLESIAPWVDEIVVVDTGSTDRTPEICREYGARLFEFPWCDDFSAARNESLRHARGEWIFWMDSDDTIPAECGDALRTRIAGAQSDNILGYVMQVHCPVVSPDGHVDVTVVDHVKLIRNCPELRFEFRIHEQILPAIRRLGGDVAWTDLYVVHSGSDRTPEGRARKLERDFRLLSLDIHDHPDHPFVLFNLGMTHADAGEHAEAMQHLQRCIDVSLPGESHVRKAYALLAASQMQQGLLTPAFQTCAAGLDRFPNDRELLFRRAMVHHSCGRPESAIRDYCRLLTPSGDRYFSSLDANLGGYKARHNLAIIYEETGAIEQAVAEWKQILKERPDYGPAHAALSRLPQAAALRH